MSVNRVFVSSVVAVTLGGCATIGLGPDRVFTVDEQVSYARENIQPVPTNVADRNSYITERMYFIDLEYSAYFSKLTSENQVGNLSGDLAILGLTATSTVVGSTAAKTALSAASTAVTGAKAAVDKDVLLSNTIQILQMQMETSRGLIRNRIIANLGAPMVKYTIWQAMSDLEDYYRAGTVPGALEALAAATGNSSQQTKDIKNGTTQIGSPVSTPSLGATSVGAMAPAIR